MLARVPELRAFLDSNNLNANQMAVIWAPPGLQGAVHIDYGKNVRILWPIKNCEGSKTKFFHIDPSNIKLSRLENGEPYYNITQQEPYEMIDEMELLTPVVFDSSIAHGIYTNPMVTEARLTFTIGVRESLSHWL
jgi:hypothetical protein